MDNPDVLNNTFFLKKEPVLRKKKKNVSLNKKNMVQVHGGAKAMRRGGALYKYPKNLGGEKYEK